ncbi:MAG TPA: excinuclease ABC subunit UvrB, partial [bacterium]|nr:excinuclease ABC subunit UvrB [bacterium]
KTLAAQLYSEFKSFFPENAVEYFVSYYDYFQPEAYIPRNDLYIEKDSSINDDIDKLRHAATHSLLTRSDVIIVASVSCIYGLGSPEAYQGLLIDVRKGMNISRSEVINKLVTLRYERNDIDFHRGVFRSRGDVLDIFPAYEEDRAIRVEFFDDEIESLKIIDSLRGEVIDKIDRIAIYPGSHYVLPEEKKMQAIASIRLELEQRLESFDQQGKLVEKQRLQQRTQYDLEMIEEVGFCKGIENYSRHFDQRLPGSPPPTLLQYFPRDFLLFVDESHISVPQIGGMYHGDRARKQTLIEYGFRLPSALDNRPLTFEEFEACLDQAVFVSATPGSYELQQTPGQVIQQVIRPTGLVDPQVQVKPVNNQVDDLMAAIKETVNTGNRVLVTTLTKRQAENLSKYFSEVGIRCRYLHSDIDTIERFQILRDLRLGDFDVLIGINLLREGLDLPEVALVAILDGDKEGFLRSERSLIQTFGRASRNINGKVIVYADTVTGSLKRALDETQRRREKQLAYNRENSITPTTVSKAIRDGLPHEIKADYIDIPKALQGDQVMNVRDIPGLILKLKKQMQICAQKMDYEEAAQLRDQIKHLREVELTLGG